MYFRTQEKGKRWVDFIKYGNFFKKVKIKIKINISSKYDNKSVTVITKN